MRVGHSVHYSSKRKRATDCHILDKSHFVLIISSSMNDRIKRQDYTAPTQSVHKLSTASARISHFL